MEENVIKKGGNVGTRLLYLLVGSAIGAGAGLLLAPRSGAETREQLASKVKEGREALGSGVKSAQEQMGKAREKIETGTQHLLSRSKGAFSREGDIVANALDAAKKAYLKEKDSWMLKR